MAAGLAVRTLGLKSFVSSESKTRFMGRYEVNWNIHSEWHISEMRVTNSYYSENDLRSYEAANAIEI